MHTYKGYISIGILIALLLIGSVLSASSPVIKKIEPPFPRGKGATQEPERPFYEGEYVSVSLSKMEVRLKRGTSTLEAMPILSIGKPGSYYETIGGAHVADYKIKKHFSSIGHVYMPWSTHVFGNFFIHGIPYYPDGTKVSTEYSGGCIRLSDEDARRVYEFVTKGTPIVVASHDEKEFLPTSGKGASVSSGDMTRYMVATISLEVLAQDSEITDTDDMTLTTRRKLLPRLIVGKEDKVSEKLAEGRGVQTFLDYMNQKAVAIGMTQTTFTSLTGETQTTAEDLERFRNYLNGYKVYLVNLSTTTQPLFQ